MLLPYATSAATLSQHVAEQTWIPGSKTPFKKLNCTSTRDLSNITLCIIFWGHPVAVSTMHHPPTYHHSYVVPPRYICHIRLLIRRTFTLGWPPFPLSKPSHPFCYQHHTDPENVKKCKHFWHQFFFHQGAARTQGKPSNKIFYFQEGREGLETF